METPAINEGRGMARRRDRGEIRHVEGREEQKRIRGRDDLRQ